jgi:hypothetical protein
MLKHLFLSLITIGFAQPVFGATPDIRSEFNCEVTYQNYVDTRNYIPQSFTGYTDGHGVGDFLTLSLQIDSDVAENVGVGFHILLTDEERNNTVFSALTSARKSSPEYPKVGTYNDGERGIGAKSVTDDRIVYNKTYIYADGMAWGFMPLKSGHAKLNLVPVGNKNYRGTLIVAPAPASDIHMFEFSQLECTLVKDSLDEFLNYYSN